MTTTVSQEAREAEVTQADRDAALPILCHLYVRKDEEPALFIGEVRAGKYDDHYLIQAFARHRQSAERGEVDRLRSELNKVRGILERLRDFDGWNGTFHAGHAYDAKQEAIAYLKGAA